jgi:ribosomal protein S18 acetylase RimI-like enzyme
MIEVRPLQPEEWQLLRGARVRAVQDAPRQFGVTHAEAEATGDDEWRALAGGDGGRRVVAIATDDGRPVGLGILERDTGERRRHRARVYAVWVDGSVRGRGVGRRLMTCLLDWARERDVVAVYLDVVVGNDPARSLYTRLGFVRRDLDPYSLRIDGEFVAQERLVLLLRHVEL